LEEKIISRLSAVQVGGPMMGRLSNVRRFASPKGSLITKTSLLTPATVDRTNASRVPSGENAASWSSQPAGGDVSDRVVESASDNTEIQARVGSAELLSENASELPSGDHERPAAMAVAP
jgi:hypothetical protein